MKTHYMTIESVTWPLQALVLDKDGVLFDQYQLADQIHRARREVFQANFGESSLRLLDASMGISETVDLMGPSVLASLDQAEVIMASIIYQFTKNSWLHCMDLAKNTMLNADNMVRADAAPLLPGVRDLATSASRAGVLLGLITSDHASRTLTELKASRLDTFFNHIVTADNTTHQKPHPEPLLHLLNQWNCRPEDVILIGDTANDWIMAQALKVRAVAVSPNPVSSPGVIATIRDLRQIHLIE